jgi:hypothetical protein
MRSKFLAFTLALVFSLAVLVSPQASAAKLGSKCTKLNSKSWDGNVPIVCLKSNGKLKWQQFTMGKPTPVKSPQLSEADKLAKQGCALMPSAIQNYSQARYAASTGDALLNLDAAMDGIWAAASRDAKYAQLKTAQKIIVEYVQATHWTGSGYFGDKNTVLISIATFNSYCGTNLSLG